MLRFTAAEHEMILAAKPDDEELASFARRALMESLSGERSTPIRRVAAFIVAALSDSIEFEEALSLFDDHMTSASE
ncbi:MAG: hypothetical protein GC190_20095 [Alphaproteobacteria bacterium]|nr:hypothetical protein [Alphaproteobacteria bacterium]